MNFVSEFRKARILDPRFNGVYIKFQVKRGLRLRLFSVCRNLVILALCLRCNFQFCQVLLSRDACTSRSLWWIFGSLSTFQVGLD